MNQEKLVYRKTAMRSVTLVGIVAPVLLMLAGCASLSKAQCLEGDWYDIGLSDGESGMDSARFDEYVDTCAKYDVVPDFAKYSEGRTKGLEFFCTRSNGYSEGRQGRVYRNVCSGASEELFLEGHLLGYNVYSKVEIIESLVSSISDKIEQIESWEIELGEQRDQLTADIVDVGSRDSQDPQEFNDFSDKSAQLHQDITQARTQIEELNDRKAEAIIEYRKAVDEANENGFQEEAIIEYRRDVDEADVNDVRDNGEF